jgi:hypothetical protein
MAEKEKCLSTKINCGVQVVANNQFLLLLSLRCFRCMIRVRIIFVLQISVSGQSVEEWFCVVCTGFVCLKRRLFVRGGSAAPLWLLRCVAACASC